MRGEEVEPEMSQRGGEVGVAHVGLGDGGAWGLWSAVAKACPLGVVSVKVCGQIPRRSPVKAPLFTMAHICHLGWGKSWGQRWTQFRDQHSKKQGPVSTPWKP